MLNKIEDLENELQDALEAKKYYKDKSKRLNQVSVHDNSDSKRKLECFGLPFLYHKPVSVFSPQM